MKFSNNYAINVTAGKIIKNIPILVESLIHDFDRICQGIFNEGNMYPKYTKRGKISAMVD